MDDRGQELRQTRLSGVRTFLLWALAVVWFTEMHFLGVRSLSIVWSHLWHVRLPADPRLAAAVSTIWSIGAPSKGALFVMAVFALRSRNPSTRAALFASMALVPPLNIAFPFRQQGFLPGPVTVGTVLSTILWGSFILFREHEPRSERESVGPGAIPVSRWETLQQAWLASYTVLVSLLALLFLFRTRTALDLALPCLSPLFRSHEGELASLIQPALGSGTHLTAVAVGAWLATWRGRRDPALRRAVAVACTVHAGLFMVFPLRRIALESGGPCAATSLLAGFAPLFVGWLLFLLAGRPRPLTSGPAFRRRDG